MNKRIYSLILNRSPDTGSQRTPDAQAHTVLTRESSGRTGSAGRRGATGPQGQAVLQRPPDLPFVASDEAALDGAGHATVPVGTAMVAPGNVASDVTAAGVDATETMDAQTQEALASGQTYTDAERADAGVGEGLHGHRHRSQE